MSRPRASIPEPEVVVVLPAAPRKSRDEFRSAPISVEVTPSPFSAYGFYEVEPTNYLDREPVVGVAERVGDAWQPTRGRWYASTIMELGAGVQLTIDPAQGRTLSVEDTAALVEYAGAFA
jgi:hypothetical protein